MQTMTNYYNFQKIWSNKMTNYIWVTTQKTYLHKYPLADSSVEYLRNSHRHLFKFKVWIELLNNDKDREIEFIGVKEKVDKILTNLGTNIFDWSCERLSKYLYELLVKEYGKREYIIEVSEDGENGVQFSYK